MDVTMASLGWNCDPASLGIEFGLRPSRADGYGTGPFDLKMSSYAGLCTCLAEDFGRFFDLEVQAGEVVNHKRVDRLYAEAGLQVKKRKCKKIPVADRHSLERPTTANQVWSMDFVFDRTAEGRSIKNLTVVDDATHEEVAIVPERALGGNQLVRILEQLASTKGLPKAIRTDNGKEFCSRAC